MRKLLLTPVLIALALVQSPAAQENHNKKEIISVPGALNRDKTLEHWAFKKLVCGQPPGVKNPELVRTPIDAFFLARLEAKGLTFSPEADRPMLIRPAYLDLIGLPPSPEEVLAFLGDKGLDAYEKLLDRLLAWVIPTQRAIADISLAAKAVLDQHNAALSAKVNALKEKKKTEKDKVEQAKLGQRIGALEAQRKSYGTIQLVTETNPPPLTFLLKRGNHLKPGAGRHVIDQEIKASWKKEKITPPAKASDSVFLRRVYLDLVGMIPTYDETTAFLKDTDPKKREKLIDKLLADPRYARQQADVWDIALLGRKPRNLGLPRNRLPPGWQAPVHVRLRPSREDLETERRRACPGTRPGE